MTHDGVPHLATVPRRLKQSESLRGDRAPGAFLALLAKSSRHQPLSLPQDTGQNLIWGAGRTTESRNPLKEHHPFLPSPRIRTCWDGRETRGRWGCWLRQAAPFSNLYSCVLQHALSIDNHVLFLTAALTPLCFFAVQICQGCWLRKYIKAFFFLPFA